MKTTKNNLSRRKFIAKSATAAAGVTLISPSLFGAPSILKHYKKPNSLINGVQIGVITYSFRSMEDQSAEAILKYILDSGINAIELIGDPAETFAGRPDNPIDMAKMWPLREKRRDGKITKEEEKELVETEEGESEDGEKEEVETNSLFIFIGAKPETEWLDGVIARDERGFIYAGADLTKSEHFHRWNRDRNPFLLETSTPGIFVAGDVRHNSVKRVASGVGEGSIAIMFVHRYLAEVGA